MASTKLFALDFLWKTIYDTIDCEDSSYNLTKSAQNIFRTHLSQSPDLLTHISTPPPYSDGSADRPMGNLVDSVHTQEDITERAHQLLWIRSPALQGSLSRSMKKYETNLPGLVQSQLYEPLKLCFDFTLAWNTHRLHPSSCRRCIDARKEGKSSAFTVGKQPTDPTQAVKQKRFSAAWPADDPCRCFCWTCEAIKSAKLIV